MDEAINRAIDAALEDLRQSKASPDFIPRLRAHVEKTRQRAPIRWWIPFAASATAIVAGLVVAPLISGWRTASPRAAAVPSVAMPQAPSASDDVPARHVSTVAANRAAQRAQRVASGVKATHDGPEVIVPPGQRAAISRLLSTLDGVDDSARSAVPTLSAADEIVIEPIHIEPVVVPPLKESM